MRCFSVGPRQPQPSSSSATPGLQTPWRASRHADRRRPLSTAPPLKKGLFPESSNPQPPNPEPQDAGSSGEAAGLSDAEYHEIADQFLNSLVLTLEEMADQDSQTGLEVEYSAGVLTIGHPSKGDYVLNKQPPNKQIWLSSPVSGPKRYDWVLRSSGGMHSKQDTEGSEGDVGDDGTLGGGKWVYLRDGSSLSELLKDELGVVIAHETESDATSGREGPAGSGVGGGIGATVGVEG